MINLKRLYEEDKTLFNELMSMQCKFINENGTYEGHLNEDQIGYIKENINAKNPKNFQITFDLGNDDYTICNCMSDVQENAYKEFKEFVESYDGDFSDACKDFKTLNKIIAIGAKLPNYIHIEEYPEVVESYIKKYGTPVANFYEALINYIKENMKSYTQYVNDSNTDVVYCTVFDDGTMYNYSTDEQEAKRWADKLNAENPDNKCRVEKSAKSEIERQF